MFLTPPRTVFLGLDLGFKVVGNLFLNKPTSILSWLLGNITRHARKQEDGGKVSFLADGHIRPSKKLLPFEHKL